MPRKTSLQGGHLIVPDIHGHLSRFQAALSASKSIPGVHLIFLGDLIDDSPRRRQQRRDHRPIEQADDSKTILANVRELHRAGKATVILGNHEIMALGAVLNFDQELLDLWWQVGGRQTAQSYVWQVRDKAGQLFDDLNWLRAHGKLWALAGPGGKQVLAAHATRPNPERILRDLNSAEFLTPSAQQDPVLWFPLAADQVNWPVLPGVQVSVHGHMEGRTVRTLTGPDGVPALQLDLAPKEKKLALLYVGEDGTLKQWIQPIASAKN